VDRRFSSRIVRNPSTFKLLYIAGEEEPLVVLESQEVPELAESLLERRLLGISRSQGEA